MGGEFDHGKLAEIAVKKLLIKKMKTKIDDRWGDKLDAVAEELVGMAEEKMKLKKEFWTKKTEMKEHLREIFMEDMEED